MVLDDLTGLLDLSARQRNFPEIFDLEKKNQAFDALFNLRDTDSVMCTSKSEIAAPNRSILPILARQLAIVTVQDDHPHNRPTLPNVIVS